MQTEREGWTFILLSHPKKDPMRLNNQPAPQQFLHLAGEDDKNAVVFTMVGRDDNVRMAFFMYGSWDFGDPETFFLRDTLNG